MRGLLSGKHSLAIFILLLYLREQLTLVYMSKCLQGTTLSTHRQIGRSFEARILPSTFSLPKTRPANAICSCAQLFRGSKVKQFVRDTRLAPKPAFLLARDRQLLDIKRFCTVPSGFSILTVDPTFKLGDFDVTPITYRHQLLETNLCSLDQH